MKIVATNNFASARSNPPSVEQLTQCDRQALGFLFQMYGTMIAAGLYNDYSLVIAENIVGMTMTSPKRSSAWISFEHDTKRKQWLFRYRSIALSGSDLTRLAYEGHAAIAALEKRPLGALIPVIIGVKGVSIETPS